MIISQSHFQPQNQPIKNFKQKKKIIIVVLIILGITTILTGIFWWIFFDRKPSFSGDNVVLKVTPSTYEVVSGNELKLTIEYSNEERVAINNVEFNLLYPEGFIFDKAISSFNKDNKETNNRFTKDKVIPGEKEKIEIIGRLIGNTKEEKKFHIIMSYLPENFNSRFSKEASIIVSIVESPIEISSDLPQVILETGKIFVYNVKLRNKGKEEIRDLKVKIDVPSFFEMLKDESVLEENNFLGVKKLEPNREENIKIKGRLYGEPGEIKIFKVQIGQVDEKGNFYLQGEKEFRVKIIKIDLSLKAKINNKETVTFADFGDEIELIIYYKNQSSENLPNVSFEVLVDEGLFDKNKIIVENGKYENKRIIWDNSTKPEFSNFDKNAEGKLIARLKIYSDIPMNSILNQNLSSKFIAKFITDLRDYGGIRIEKESNQLELKVNTKVNYNIEIRYYDQGGKKIVGNGPLPPKVGKETIYRVYLTLFNTINDVLNPKIEVYIPNYILFKGNKNVSNGNLDYFDGKIVWSLDRLLAGAGKIVSPYEASFNISIIPTSEMIGTTPKLIKKSIFTGKDDFTGNSIVIERGILTTELEKDFTAKKFGEKVVN